MFPWGVYFFKRLAMGLSNSAQTFQRVVDSVLEGVEGVFAYLDDLLIYTDANNHEDKVEEVIRKLAEAGLAVAVDKCKFEQSEIDFLGYNVSSQGIRPLQPKIDAIKNFPTPKNQKQLLHYLGAINYFRASLPYLPPDPSIPGSQKKSPAEVLMPLYSLATCKIEKGTKFTDMWSESIDKAYEKNSLPEPLS